MKLHRIALILAVAGVALGFAAVSLTASVAPANTVSPIPEYGRLPDFQLTDDRGDVFGLSDLDGKIWVADFIFTSCSGVCPIMSSKMAELQTAFADYAEVNFVSISVDPANDTPEVLREYGVLFGADPERWRFLTGDSDAIQDLAVKGFMLGFGGEMLIHSERFVLVDKTGAIRGYYEGTTPDGLLRLSRDIGVLLEESH